MPNEVFLFAASALLFIVLGTLASSVFWLLHSTPLPSGLVPQPVALRVRRLLPSRAPGSTARRSR
jgi:hypothetical protein